VLHAFAPGAFCFDNPTISARSKRGPPGPSTQIGQRERLPHGEAVYYDAAALERAASEGGPYKSVRRIDHERSGTDDDADGCRGSAGSCGSGGCGIFVGFLVSGGAEHGDSRQRLVTAMLLEVPLVLGRTAEGKAFAMRDSCPHRGIPLSYGRLDGNVVECCYHGWRFDACSGQCVEIPSLSSQDKLKVERIFAGHFPCEERDGYVWVT